MDSCCQKSRKSGNKDRRLVVLILIIPIRFYQLVISPMLGPKCRFEPTCSHYCEQAITTHGIIRGLALSVKRIAKCHPWHPGGFDPVPKNENTIDNR